MWRKLFKTSPLKRAIFFIAADIIIFYVALRMAYNLRFNFHLPPEHVVGFAHLVWIYIAIKITLLFIFRIYFITWRYFVLEDYRRVMYALIISAVIFILYVKTIYHGQFPRTVLPIDFLLSFFLIGLLRFAKRIFQDFRGNKLNPTLIIGANQKAAHAISSAQDGSIDYFPVAIVDNDKSLVGSYLYNKKVHPCESMEFLIEKYDINSAIITKEYSPDDLDALFERLKKAGVERIKLSKILANKEETLQDIAIEDLLARRPKDLDTKVIDSLIRDKVVMITGAGGSIGSEIARQCARSGAKRLILLDHSEYNLYEITEALLYKDVVPLMQSVVDKKLLEKSFDTYRPQIVIHAAAYKHVPLCEENIEGAILNNIIGTKNTIDLSIAYGVEKFVLISTDKAVRPTNVMGATKRICELYAQNVDSRNTLITAVRFGNVLGSSGSVIPKFKRLISQNRPLTITHPDITRYFMLIPEACQLVLQAAAIAQKNELFILDMGKPVKIVDLAQKMLKIYGKEDLGIRFTGLRKGEKLYEELLIEESDKKTMYDSILISKTTSYDIDKLNAEIEELLIIENKLKKLKDILPEFQHEVQN
jgi:UDP-N-acetyl-D-glucosamine 4,6-dehydratase